MSAEIRSEHINMNVLENDTATGLKWVYDSIVTEWQDELTNLRELKNTSQESEVVKKAYEVIGKQSGKSDADILTACAGGASCLIFALQIILVKEGHLQGKKCIDGIYGEKTKQAIIDYKKKGLGYEGALGSINARFINAILAKQPVNNTNPINTNPVPQPGPIITPEIEVEEPEDPGLTNLVNEMPSWLQDRVKVFVEKVMKNYAGVCDKNVAVLFEVIESKGKNAGNPIIRLQTKRRVYEYPYFSIADVGSDGFRNNSEIEGVQARICTYLNSQRKHFIKP